MRVLLNIHDERGLAACRRRAKSENKMLNIRALRAARMFVSMGMELTFNIDEGSSSARSNTLMRVQYTFTVHCTVHYTKPQKSLIKDLIMRLLVLLAHEMRLIKHSKNKREEEESSHQGVFSVRCQWTVNVLLLMSMIQLVSMWRVTFIIKSFIKHILCTCAASSTNHLKTIQYCVLRSCSYFGSGCRS
jgi:hypothetical protein